MPYIVFFAIIALLLIIEWVIRPKFYKNRIRKYMSNYGADIVKIERIAFREFIYVVEYLKDKKLERKTVKLSFWEDDCWY